MRLLRRWLILWSGLPCSMALAPVVGRELFSVAPMMAHTHTHWRFFFRLISQHSVLFTEMIPAATIAAAEARGPHATSELLRFNPEEHPVVLQLGGHSVEELAIAAAAGTRLGYDGINLNCGCPSSAVAGTRKGGAALMREPAHVATCCAVMHEAMEAEARRSDMPVPVLSVKHRLGVVDVSNYDPVADRADEEKGAAQDLETASNFIETVSSTGVVNRFQVHARKALLGIGIEDRASDTGPDTATGVGADRETSTRDSSLPVQPQPRSEADPGAGDAVETTVKEITADSATKAPLPGLWMPATTTSSDAGAVVCQPKVKIDHKRVQYQAKKRASAATVANRSVPPLRQGVVNELARRFPHLDVICNGQVQSVAESRALVEGTGLHGVMVGRAVINHPCSFGSVDTELFQSSDPAPSRGEVLHRYIEYVAQQETLAHAHAEPGETRTAQALVNLRRSLVAPPFNLFAGEPGCAAFMRRIRKMTNQKAQYSAAAVLRAALAELPTEALDKPVNSACCSSEIPQYEIAKKRSGPLQRQIY